MRRDTSREGPKRFQDPQRGPPSQIPTPAKLLCDTARKWLRICRAAIGCTHHHQWDRAAGHSLGPGDIEQCLAALRSLLAQRP
jgi:hypothetical protein